MNQRDITESLLRTIDIISNNSAVNTSNSQPKVLTAEVTDITQREKCIYGVTYQGRQVFAKSSSNFLYEKGDDVLILFPTADEGDPNVVLVGPAAATSPGIPGGGGDIYPVPDDKIKDLFDDTPIYTPPGDYIYSITEDEIRILFNKNEGEEEL